MISRYLSGEMSPGELERFRELMRKEPELSELLEDYLKIWDSAGSHPGDPAYDLDREWLLLKNKIPALSHPEAGPDRSRSLIRGFYRIAAVLVLGFILSFAANWLVRSGGTNRVVAGSEQVEILLDDGSHVVLNRNSSLRYPKSFGEQKRQLALQGEAWFEVAKDSSLPFIIEAGPARIEVLGTSFNVNAYRENPSVEITVESGLVALSAKRKQEEQIVMTAGSGGSMDKREQELTLIPSADRNKISWHTREFDFRGTSLKEVCATLSHAYGVNLIIVNPELEKCPITVSFMDQSLEGVLKVLEKTLDLELSKSGEEIRLDGSTCD